MTVRVQQEDFNAPEEVGALYHACENPGAVVTFTGLVRGLEERGQLEALVLEHYPGMTERQLEVVETEARKRWALQDCLIIHRYGTLKPKEQIVLVACISAHRTDAFEAASFLMDWLKTEAPFWKKEIYGDGTSWVDAKESDQKKAKRWED
jgi:molybdopterin synthase catalytic subunit